MSKDMTASSSTWHYRFENHRVVWGTIGMAVSLVLLAIASHDDLILQDFNNGKLDINALNSLYLHIENYQALNILTGASVWAFLGSIVYLVLVKIAHGKIAKDRFPL